MMTLLALASVAATMVTGLGLVCLVQRRPSSAPGAAVLAAGAAYPVGALAVATWMRALAALGVEWSLPLALVPPGAGIAALAWMTRNGLATGVQAAWHGVARRDIEGAARLAWFALLGWLALRFAFLQSEVLARPPLPWEAWLDTAARGAVWHAWRDIVPFVAASEWSNGRYLAGLPPGHALPPLLDAWTAVVAGRFDDTVIHAPWPMFWLSQVLLVYGAIRTAGAPAIAALASAALVGTLPLANAHAALGGTAALPLGTYLLAAVVFASRTTGTRAPGDVAVTVAAIAGMLWSSRAGVLWLPVLLPIAMAAVVRPERLPRLSAGLVAGAVIAASAAARLDPFARGAVPSLPAPGMGVLAEHALLHGNWHLLAYAALALGALAWRQWSAPALAGLSGAIGVGLAVLAVLVTTSAGRTMIGATGVVGHASTAFAPLLALWVAQVAFAWVRAARLPEPVPPATGVAHDAGDAGDAQPPAAPPGVALPPTADASAPR